ncbi:type II toxin-antitoxin system HigB family toxin [Deinococcus marmoris]|uniref:type II toxin-antitoxin system HigB family toxin n=1 Tax=Deinococcus marmoris TaxID=249408 RepID=UPI00096A9DD5|nr:type II toxin-antitoxin system HigB family toxin [Deinococcus marmoris]
MRKIIIEICNNQSVGMNALTLAALIAFWLKHPDAEGPLRIWYRQVRHNEYQSFADVKADFGSADWVQGFIVFDLSTRHFLEGLEICRPVRDTRARLPLP